MNIRVIKTRAEYETALREAEQLISVDAPLEDEESDRLELLSVLIEKYEKDIFPLDPPDPVGAIEFRMAEQGLKQKDLVPLLGSRSRVSEVLSRKRPLTVQMIRALSDGLGIPLQSLIPPLNSTSNKPADYDWKCFPYKEMDDRGWFEPLREKGFKSSEDLVRAFMEQISPEREPAALFRRNIRGQNSPEKGRYAILAWTARVLSRARDRRPPVSFSVDRITADWLRSLVGLSLFSKGPLLAVEFLEKAGIVVVIEPQLPGTLIDGAALLTSTGVPVIALTLRFDRVDNFWFTLLHELAHIWKHVTNSNDFFVDRLEKQESSDALEKEANRIARDALVPRAVWKRSPAFLAPSKENIFKLAYELHIHPGIIVGRLHIESGSYTQFRDLLGQGEVRNLFGLAD